MLEKLSPYLGEGKYKFTLTDAPLPWGYAVGSRKTWDIKTCTGFSHCEQNCEVNGFFLTEARAVPTDAIFREWDEIVNEIALHLRSCGTPQSRI